MTFVLLIYQVVPEGALPPAEEQRVLERHRELQATASRRGQLHAVARLASERHATRVSMGQNGEYDLVDGAFIETKEWLVGFYLMDASNEAEALERAKQICTSPYHAIEVRRVDWRWEG